MGAVTVNFKKYNKIGEATFYRNMGKVVNETFSLMLSRAIDIISDIVLPVMAIVICVFCFKRNAED